MGRMDQVRIGRCQLSATAARPPAAGRLRRLLGDADLHPPSLPPASVLLVRRLQSRTPGIEDPNGRPWPNRGWEAAVQRQLAAWARRAARPSRGRLPADAEAVLFADESELLACYLLDLGQGLASSRWWWRHLHRGLGNGPATAAARAAASHPERLPSLLSRLAAWDAAEPVLALLGEAQSRRLGGELGRIFAVEWARELLAAFDRDDPIVPIDGPGRVSPRRPIDPLDDPAAVAVDQALAVRPDDRSRPAQTALLALALALDAAPGRACSAAFGRRLLARLHRRTLWCEAAGGGAPVERSHAATPATGTADPVWETPSAPTPDARGAGPSADPAPAAWDPLATGDREEERIPPTAASHGAASAAGDPPTPPGGLLSRVGPGPGEEAGAVAPNGARRDPAPAPTASRVTTEAAGPAAAAEGLRTACGGVFYLVNLMHRLDLPRALESPWRLASELGAWGCLAALARSLLGPSHGDDPIWTLLDGLGGAPAPGTAPAPGQPRPDWRLPPSWLDDLVRLRLRAGSDAERVWLAETDGWLLFDLARNPGPPRAQLAREWRRYGRRERWRIGTGAHWRTPAGTTGDSLAQRALGYLHPFVADYLARRLGVHRAALADLLLRRPATLSATPTHVDVLLPMSAIEIAVRRAGLDRDPGWSPQFGRVIGFHFREEGAP
jgi:hypothetical protein